MNDKEIYAAIAAALKPINDLMMAQSKVVKDLAEQVRALRPSTTPPPVATGRVVAGGSLSWQGSIWTIVGGKINRNGQVVPETELTKDVAWIEVRDKMLVQGTNDGREWQYTGVTNWKLLTPKVSITVQGTLGR